MLPHFEVKDISAGGGGGAAPAIVELSKLSKAALLPPPPAASAAAAAASTISVADASAMLVPPSASASVAESKRSKTAAALAADADGDAVDVAGDLDGAAGEGEESLGDRARRMGGGAASATSRLEAPKADSVAVLLQQGLQVTGPPGTRAFSSLHFTATLFPFSLYPPTHLTPHRRRVTMQWWSRSCPSNCHLRRLHPVF